MSRLVDLAKHLVAPQSAVSTGWPRVRDTSNNLGWEFDQWQDDLGRLILSKNADGLYAASICAMSLPRQVGKTYLVGCIAFVLCMTQPGTTVIWTAHRGRTATETFRAMKAKAKTPEMAAFVDQRAKGGGIRSSNGEQEIEFLNGSRILFGARESGFGVGFADVGMLVIDEVQRAQTKTMDDLLPTTNAAANPLVLCMGTPPRPTDDGEVFTMLRTEAVGGESEDVLYVELGATRRFELSDEHEFWRQLRLVNPAFPHRVGERAILRNKKGLTDDSVFREVFGLWDEQSAGEVGITLEPWQSLGLSAVPPEWPLAAVGLDMHPTTGRLYVGVGAFAPEPGVHVELVEQDILAAGMDGAVDWIVKRAGRRLPVVMPADSPATMLHAALKKARVQVYVLNLTEQWQASAAIERAVVTDGTLTHFTDPLLDQAVKESTREQHRAPGQWRLGRTGELQGSPLWAVTAAHFGAVKWSKRRGAASSKESARSGRTSGGRASTSREAVGV